MRKFQKIVFTEKFRKLVESLMPPDTPEKKKRYEKTMKKYIAFEKIYKETKFLTRNNTTLRNQKSLLGRGQTRRRFIETEGANMEVIEEEKSNIPEFEMQAMPMRQSSNHRSEQSQGRNSLSRRSSQQRRRLANNI